MRPPSPKIRANAADLYRLDVTRPGAFDADGGIVAANAYPPAPDVAGIPCRACLNYGGADASQGRVGAINDGLIIFGTSNGIGLNDKLVIAGASYYTMPETDMASAGSAWGVAVRAMV